MNAAQEMPWIKIYTRILDNPSIGRLGDTAWRFYMELQLIAGRTGEAKLPSLREIAWYLREPNGDRLAPLMEQFTERGLLSLDKSDLDRPWSLPNFTELKAPYSGESWYNLLRRAIMVRDNWTCRYCGAPAEHVDHIVPRCQDGTNDPDNLAAACATCNCSKGGRTPEQAGMELLS